MAEQHLVQILLPLADNDGQAFPMEMFREVQAKLTERFGGLTAFTRAPAEGHWRDRSDSSLRDDIVVFEVMVEKIDKAWWRDYRLVLETEFSQESVLIRALSATTL